MKAFADALGLGSKSLTQTVKSSFVGGTSDEVVTIEHRIYDNLAGVPLFSELFRPENPKGLVHVPSALSFSTTEKIKHLMKILRKPLYSADMIAWAKNYRMDLLKVEKRIQELIAGLLLLE